MLAVNPDSGHSTRRGLLRRVFEATSSTARPTTVVLCAYEKRNSIANSGIDITLGLSSTWLLLIEAEVRARDAADLEALTSALEEAQIDHEVWTTNVRILCKQCSEGTPHEHTSEKDLAPA